MNLVDSSAWLEYFGNGPHADYFAAAIEATDDLLVPTICLYEVFKRVARERSENDAFRALSAMQQGTVIDLTTEIALNAARLGPQLKLPMADSIIYATAYRYGAALWTQDEDFATIPGVHYKPHAARRKGRAS